MVKWNHSIEGGIKTLDFLTSAQLFRDLPAAVAGERLPEDSFAWFYETLALPAARERAKDSAGKGGGSAQDDFFHDCLREEIDRFLEEKRRIRVFPRSGSPDAYDIFDGGYAKAMEQSLQIRVEELRRGAEEPRPRGGLFARLLRAARPREEAEEQERSALAQRVEKQKLDYRWFLECLWKADRQLKFLDLWHRAAGGLGHFPGWFDVNDYQEQARAGLLPEARPYAEEAERRERQRLRKMMESREELEEKLENFQATEDPYVHWRTELKGAGEARARLNQSFGENGILSEPEEAFRALEAALGYPDLPDAEPYPEGAPGGDSYRQGLREERLGRNYRFARSAYEAAAQKNHIPALARLAGIYELDREAGAIAGSDNPGQGQGLCKYSEEAPAARRILGLSQDAPLPSILRRTWQDGAGFDPERLTCLVRRCRRAGGELARLMSRFAAAALLPAACDGSAGAIYALALLDLEEGQPDAARLWAQAAAGVRYGPALYLLYADETLGEEKSMRAACCRLAWDKGYPPARVCAGWPAPGAEEREAAALTLQRWQDSALSQAADRQLRRDK